MFADDKMMVFCKDWQGLKKEGKEDEPRAEISNDWGWESHKECKGLDRPCHWLKENPDGWSWSSTAWTKMNEWSIVIYQTTYFVIHAIASQKAK